MNVGLLEKLNQNMWDGDRALFVCRCLCDACKQRQRSNAVWKTKAFTSVFLRQSALLFSSPAVFHIKQRKSYGHFQKLLLPTRHLCPVCDLCLSVCDSVCKDTPQPCLCAGQLLSSCVCLCCNLSDTLLVSLQMPCPTNDRQTHGSVN